MTRPEHWRSLRGEAHCATLIAEAHEEARMPAPVTDNAYGNPVEESQRGPRTIRGTKTPSKVTKPYPKGKQ